MINNRIHYTNCPICDSTYIKEVLSVKDHTVSGEMFPIMECNQCSLRFTQDIPDAVSIAPYYKSEDYISHTNTSKGLINRIYKFVRNSTMVRKRKLLEKYTGLQKGTMLDLGSGVGAFVNEMKQHGWKVSGIEPDEDARKAARQLYELDLSNTVEFYRLDAGKFDAISLWHVLEHVHDLTAYILQLRKILNDKGKLFIAVPNYSSLDARIYAQYWAAYDVPRHLYHFSPKSMKWLMEKNGMNILHYKPMWYDSFYISLLSSKYKNKSTNWFGAAWSGFWSNVRALASVKKCSSVIYIIEKNAQ